MILNTELNKAVTAKVDEILNSPHYHDIKKKVFAALRDIQVFGATMTDDKEVIAVLKGMGYGNVDPNKELKCSK